MGEEGGFVRLAFLVKGMDHPHKMTINKHMIIQNRRRDTLYQKKREYNTDTDSSLGSLDSPAKKIKVSNKRRKASLDPPKERISQATATAGAIFST